MQNKNEIDVTEPSYYEYGGNCDRTLQRLIEIKELGMSVVGTGHFGIEGVMSGLYIERVWAYSNEKWDSYINWVKEIKNN